MAISAGDKPRSASFQAERFEVDKATWKTGTSPASRGELPEEPLPENEVAFTIQTGLKFLI